MKRDTGHVHIGPRRRVRADGVRRLTRRRLLIGAAAWPLITIVESVRAQAKQAPILIGWFEGGTRKANEHRLAAFKEGLAALVWKQGTDYQLEERWADGRSERMQALAEELAAKKPVLIVAAPSPPVRAAVKAAPNTPVVQANGDPLITGAVTSLARPGGMVTGVSNVNSETNEKFLELLLVAAPKLRRVGFLVDPDSKVSIPAARRSLERYRVDARFAEAAKPEEIEPALSRLAKDGVQALIAMSSPWFIAERRRIIGLAQQHRWPLITGQSEFAEAGALMSYGVDRTALFRRATYYVDRILKGAKPGDLPIEQPTKFELIVNAKTAKALGLTISPELRLRADRVIE